MSVALCTVGGAELDTGNIDTCRQVEQLTVCGVSVTSVGEKDSIEPPITKYWVYIGSHFSVCQPRVQIKRSHIILHPLTDVQ